MKECIKCKAQLEDDELFCHECGTRQEIEEVNSQVEEVQESGCKKCFHCGETIEDDSLFCPFCGKPQDVENVKNEEPQKEVEKEAPQQKPAEPESLQEHEEEVPQQETVEQESLQEPEEEEPLQESVEQEQVQTEEQGSVLPPQPESSEQPKQPEQPEKSEAEEQATDEGEEKRTSKTWFWILLGVILLGILGGGYYYMSNKQEVPSNVIDTDSIAEEKDSMAVDIHSVKGIKLRVNDILSKALKMSDQDAIHTYFSKEYQELYDKTIELDNMGCDGDVGFWNKSIWNGSQDGDPDAFEIVRVSTSAEQYAFLDVDFSHNVDTYHSEERIPMTLVFENGNWFIDDVNQMKGLMEEYINSSQEEDKEEQETQEMDMPSEGAEPQVKNTNEAKEKADEAGDADIEKARKALGL